MTPDDAMAAVVKGVARLEALRVRDALQEAGVPALLDPDSGMDLGRPTNVLVPGSRAEFARRVVADTKAAAEWVPDNSPEGLLSRISEHLDAVRGRVD